MSTTNGSQSAALANLASIIIPCCGMLEYTKLLVPSLLEYTREPYELIFMDIGSLDGTAEYLAGLAAGVRHCRVTVVRAETDLGIADACREALGSAAGDYIVLLNNDTIVPEHWLNQLIGLAASFGDVGLVGPMSNYAAPPQLVEVVPYRCEGLGARGEAREMRGEWPRRGARELAISPLAPPLSPLTSTPSPRSGASSTTRNGSTPNGWAGSACSSSVGS
jgi:cellulose synthase/poly-beta-1,6-N-acetylglucosamine synthase-like glycosyltransferase